jgi:hypothetical protein
VALAVRASNSNPAAAGPQQRDLDRLLSAALAALDARDGAIWVADDSGQLTVGTQSGLGRKSIDREHTDWPGHQDLLQGVLVGQAPRVVSARFEPDRPGARPRDLLILVHPITVEGRRLGLLELFLAQDRQNISEEQALRLVGGLIHAFRPEAQSPQSPAIRQGVDSALEFSLRAHQSLDLTTTAYTIAAEVQRLLKADRVSVLRVDGRKPQLLAMSGVDRPDPRSPSVKQLESLAGSGAGREQSLHYDGEMGRIPLRFKEAMQSYVTRTGATRVEAAPLKRGDTAFGLLLVENLSSSGDSTPWALLPALAAISSSALAQAIEHSDLPFFGLVHRLHRGGITRSWTRRLVRLGLLGLTVAGGIALCTWPTDFSVTGRGSLVPEVRREVFAPQGGVVEEVRVRHAQDVLAGDVIARLRSPNLEYETTRVQGELQTAEQQIADITSLRTDPNRAQSSQSGDAELAAKEEELKSVRSNLTRQLELLAQQRATLDVAAPIGGRVLTWDVDQALLNRPVERGHRMMTLGDVSGPWIVEVRIPDRDVGHLKQALAAANGGAVAATFSVTTDLDHEIRGELKSLGDVVEDDPIEGPNVLARIQFDRGQLKELLPGASVVARVDCGRRVVGYVWFRRLIDFVKTWWRF